MQEDFAGRPSGMIANLKHESKVGLIDRDIGKEKDIFHSKE